MTSFYNSPARVYRQIAKNITIQYPRVLQKSSRGSFGYTPRKMRVPLEGGAVTSLYELFQYKNGSVTPIPNSQGNISNFIADAGNLAWISKNSNGGDWEVMFL